MFAHASSAAAVLTWGPCGRVISPALADHLVKLFANAERESLQCWLALADTPQRTGLAVSNAPT
jgi:hypothetical protein